MNVFTALKESFIRASLHYGKLRTRQYLLNMNDSLLQDAGFSRHLLLQGVDAWPWRTETEQSPEFKLITSVEKVVPVEFGKRTVKQAIRELNTYSDRELAELGVTRHGIEEAVRYGRPNIEGGVDDQRRAA